ncbi:SMP-30/gluconolactonase/LRE family protein [Nesterenkonia ebinurensis]|uniref:SMP-30/gluconolactonase/LRE family protein n=1 Tax=Nesterenkonia ebinurensis TaxID=2608252 RepID=UPI00123C8343|nr:SMP-30/gluconolactonase/LRE family protein [Nesterenkonia ebinurensis]
MSQISIERAGAAGDPAQLGEGPVWDSAAQVLWWVDIYAGAIHRHDPAGEDGSWMIGEHIGCLAPRQQGGLVLATRSGFHRFDPATGKKTPIADPEVDQPQNRFNDGAVDPRGRFWAGTMKDRGEVGPAGSFWRLDPDHSSHRGQSGVSITNGLAFSPQGERIYFSDTARQQIWQADYDQDTGEHGELEPFFSTRDRAGAPDGAAVDADGCYWGASLGGWSLLRITPDGRLDRAVELPVEKPTKPMFGGADLKTLYVTSMGEGMVSSLSDQPLAGALLAVHGHGTQGLPQPHFAG